MVEVLGIKNCDKVRAARKWLDTANIDYQFHDIRENPVDNDHWGKWLNHFGWEVLINRRSTSWKKLEPSQRDSLDNQKAILLLANNPTLMKRPLLIDNDKPQLLGFEQQQYRDFFK